MSTSDRPTRSSHRRWLWLVVGYALGLLTALVLVSTPKTRWSYRLTRDVDLEHAYFFQGSKGSPMRGVLGAGSTLDLESRKSAAYYISFHTVVDGPRLSPICEPIGGSPPFLLPEHAIFLRDTLKAPQIATPAPTVAP